MKVEKPRGTRDFNPEEMGKRDFVEVAIAGVFKAYNYRKILTPTFEPAELFRLKSGEEIKEHMYVFRDKSDRELCLRPEMTASVCRMYASELISMQKPLKVYYSCPMFRYERPQKGRYREFWQLGIELIGADNSLADAEVIRVAVDSLNALGLEFELEIGSIGLLRSMLDDFRVPKEKHDSVIASIDKGDTEILKKFVDSGVFYKIIGMKGGSEKLREAAALLRNSNKSAEQLNRLMEIAGWLDMLKTKYTINLGRARGLEYYTGMIFELRVDGLGAENQICGGGRYDNLVKLFGGPDTPAVGFAFGFDRVVEACEIQKKKLEKKERAVVIAQIGNTTEQAWRIAANLRKNPGNVKVDLNLIDRKLDKILEYADRINAEFVVIVGEKELKNNSVVVKNMRKKKQEEVKIANLIEKLS